MAERQDRIDAVLASKSEAAKRAHRECAVAFVTYDGAAADLNELANYVARLEMELLRIRRAGLPKVHSLARSMEKEQGWRPIESAPKDGTEFLAWFPKLRLDDEDNPTSEVVGGAQAIINFTGGSWNEPEWLNASGSYYMDDWCFADDPTLWHPLPAPVSQEVKHVR